ncbi:MAG: glycosyltransferase family 87 protein [Candidatus Limnocylindrales bacterium]
MGLVLSTVAAIVGLLLLLMAMPILRQGPNWALDFLAYRDAALRLGSDGSLYAAATLVDSFHPGPTGLYVYPPPLGISVSPLSGWSFEAGATMWYLLHIVALVATCALMPVQLSIRLAAFGVAAMSFAVLRDLTMGNVSVLLLLPMAVGWRWLDRPLGSVALAIAASVRISYGLYLIWFALRRAWPQVVWMGAAGMALIVVSLPFVGIDGYRDYLTLLGNVGDTTGVLRNSDLASSALKLGVPGELAGWALVPGFAVATAAVLLGLRRDAEVGYMITLGASYLLTPLLWDHYLAMLVLPASFVAARGRPWALALPLLSWLPAVLLPFVLILAALLPLAARDRKPDATGAVRIGTAPRAAPG